MPSIIKVKHSCISSRIQMFEIMFPNFFPFMQTWYIGNIAASSQCSQLYLWPLVWVSVVCCLVRRTGLPEPQPSQRRALHAFLPSLKPQEVVSSSKADKLSGARVDWACAACTHISHDSFSYFHVWDVGRATHMLPSSLKHQCISSQAILHLSLGASPPLAPT